VRSPRRAVSAIGVRHLFHNLYPVAVYHGLSGTDQLARGIELAGDDETSEFQET
jgi:hypothetical protein